MKIQGYNRSYAWIVHIYSIDLKSPSFFIDTVVIDIVIIIDIIDIVIIIDIVDIVWYYYWY